MKKITITKVSSQTRVANLIKKEIVNAISFYSYPSIISIDATGNYYKTIVVEPCNITGILTFAEIDSIREVVDKYAEKYHGIGYYITTRPYLASDNETWLSKPVMEINVTRYDEDIFNK